MTPQRPTCRQAGEREVGHGRKRRRRQSRSRRLSEADDGPRQVRRSEVRLRESAPIRRVLRLRPDGCPVLWRSPTLTRTAHDRRASMVTTSARPRDIPSPYIPHGSMSVLRRDYPLRLVGSASVLADDLQPASLASISPKTNKSNSQEERL